MGHISLRQIYDRIMLLESDDSKAQLNCGAVHTLKVLLTKSGENFEEIGKQLTAMYSNEKSQLQTFGEKILEFFATHAPNQLAAIALNSHVFRDYMSAKICETILRIRGEHKL